jgi:peptidoglycan/LPS O-acetylase OafA/YrhL
MNPTNQPPTITSPKAHLHYLDGLRALAALFVVVHHAFLNIWPKPETYTGSAAALGVILAHGHYAVDLFIVLSGFCLMYPVTRAGGTIRGGATQFFLRRAWRILPPYWLALFFSLVLVWFFIGTKTGSHWDVSLPVTMKSIVTHLFLVHDVYAQDYTINHAFWSIAVEWRIYFLFPLLVWVAARFGIVKTMLVACIVSCFLYDPIGKRIAHSLTIHYVGLFAMGMVAAQVSFAQDAMSLRMKKLPWLIIGLLPLIGANFYARHLQAAGGELPIYLEDTAVGLASMSLLIAVARREAFWLTRALSWKPLVFVGGFSYSLYLIHSPLLEVLQRYYLPTWQETRMDSFVLLALAGTPIIVIASYLFYLVAERPFASGLPGSKAKRSTPAPMPTLGSVHAHIV